MNSVSFLSCVCHTYSAFMYIHRTNACIAHEEIVYIYISIIIIIVLSPPFFVTMYVYDNEKRD